MLKALVITLTICMLTYSCKNTLKLTEVKAEEHFEFPLDWIGAYEGELLIFNPSNDTARAKMELIIDYPNAEGYYPWTLKYNDTDIRSYGLEAINPQMGHYRIDEFNSIKLDSYFKAGHFISRFDVLGSDLLIDYCRTSEGIEVLLYISRSEAFETTGGEIIAQDTVPEVNSYRMVAFQKALLKPVELSK